MTPASNLTIAILRRQGADLARQGVVPSHDADYFVWQGYNSQMAKQARWAAGKPTMLDQFFEGLSEGWDDLLGRSHKQPEASRHGSTHVYNEGQLRSIQQEERRASSKHQAGGKANTPFWARPFMDQVKIVHEYEDGLEYGRAEVARGGTFVKSESFPTVRTPYELGRYDAWREHLTGKQPPKWAIIEWRLKTPAKKVDQSFECPGEAKPVPTLAPYRNTATKIDRENLPWKRVSAQAPSPEPEETRVAETTGVKPPSSQASHETASVPEPVEPPKAGGWRRPNVARAQPAPQPTQTQAVPTVETPAVHRGWRR